MSKKGSSIEEPFFMLIKLLDLVQQLVQIVQGRILGKDLDSCIRSNIGTAIYFVK